MHAHQKISFSLQSQLMKISIGIMLLVCTSLTGCSKKIVTTWVDDKKHGFEETFNREGELILRECFQEGVRVELSLCDE